MGGAPVFILKIGNLKALTVLNINCRAEISIAFSPRRIYTVLGKNFGLKGENLDAKIHRGQLNAKGFRFAIVESRWNDFITTRLTEGALEALESVGATEENVEVFKVPGSFELPLTAKKLAKTEIFDAIICLGVVIRGETPHFDYVAGEAAKGISQVGLTTGIPVVFGVVTADTVEQAINRAGVKSGNKGHEAAISAVEVANLYKAIDSSAKTSNEGKKAVPHVA